MAMKSRFLFVALIGVLLLLNSGSAEARNRHSNNNHYRNNHHYKNNYHKPKDHGPAAPEPISSALFGLGAGAVALKKFRDRK